MSFRLFTFREAALKYEKSDSFRVFPHAAYVGESWSCAKSSLVRYLAAIGGTGQALKFFEAVLEGTNHK